MKAAYDNRMKIVRLSYDNRTMNRTISFLERGPRSSVFVDTQYLMIQKVGKRDPTGILIVLLTVIAYIWHFLMAFS